MSEGGTFNINSQSAGVIHQAGRDMTIGTSHGTLATPLAAIADLRVALANAPLDRGDRRRTEAALREIDSELHKPEPDKHLVAGQLWRIVGILGDAGAAVSGVERLVDPLRQMAGWLGDAAGPLLGVLS